MNWPQCCSKVHQAPWMTLEKQVRLMSFQTVWRKGIRKWFIFLFPPGFCLWIVNVHTMGKKFPISDDVTWLFQKCWGSQIFYLSPWCFESGSGKRSQFEVIELTDLVEVAANTLPQQVAKWSLYAESVIGSLLCLFFRIKWTMLRKDKVERSRLTRESLQITQQIWHLWEERDKEAGMGQVSCWLWTVM